MKIDWRELAVWTDFDPGDEIVDAWTEILTDVLEAAALDFIARLRTGPTVWPLGDLAPYVTIDGERVADATGPTQCTRAVDRGLADAAAEGRVIGWPETDPADHPASTGRRHDQDAP